jgi:DNA repair protein RadA/Sms
MEASRLGFKNCIIPSGNMKSAGLIKDAGGIVIRPAESIMQALEIVL